MAILIFIIILSILVMIHEFGHFIMAKRAGIGVEEFGFGLPPRIWGKKIHGTIYSVNWLPFGGFVRLVGEDPTDKNRDAKNSFYNKSIWQRSVVIVAGVFMNFLLAVVIFYIVVIALGFKVSLPLLVEHKFKFVNEGRQVLVGNVGGAKTQGGVQIGESILEVNGRYVSGAEELQTLVDGSRSTIKLENPINNSTRNLSLALKSAVQVSSVNPRSQAEKAGVEAGWFIESIDGQVTHSTLGVQKIVRANENKEINIILVNDEGEEKSLKATPIYDEKAKNPVLGLSMQNVLFYGDETADYLSPTIETSELVSLKYETLSQKVFAGFIHSYNTVEYSFNVFGQLIGYSVKNRDIGAVSEGVSGPVGIAAITSQAVAMGPVSVLQLMGLLSLNLAVLNILPFPALDGGRFFFIIVELVTRKKVHAVLEKWVHTIGFALLLGLILLITYNDILKLIR